MSDKGEARVSPVPENRYYADARSWAEDRNEATLRSRKVAWVVAGVAATVAIVEALALIVLMPLKTVVPYTLLVDRTTGFAQLLEGVSPQAIKSTEALTQAQLAQYVVARETFQIESMRDQYRKVALWSAGDARRDYLALMPRSNADSPLNLYPRSSMVKTEIESVSPIDAQTAMVRFRTQRYDAGRPAPTSRYWVAFLHYRYSGEPLSIEDRLVNPLGFQVLNYRRDQEASPPPPITDPHAILPGSPSGAAPFLAPQTIIVPTPALPRRAVPPQRDREL